MDIIEKVYVLFKENIIEGIYETKEQAEEIIKYYKKKSNCNDFRIEEHLFHEDLSGMV